MIEEFLAIFKDGLFAAIAAIGFTSISNPPRRVFPFCAIVAACGHMARYCVMTYAHASIIPGSLAGATVIGVLAMFAASMARVPAESISFPSLLPMVPGMYAYRAVQALCKCLGSPEQDIFLHYLYLLRFNCMTCSVTIIAMVVGVTVPIFLFRNLSFKMTR